MKWKRKRAAKENHTKDVIVLERQLVISEWGGQRHSVCLFLYEETVYWSKSEIAVF